MLLMSVRNAFFLKKFFFTKWRIDGSDAFDKRTERFEVTVGTFCERFRTPLEHVTTPIGRFQTRWITRRNTFGTH